MNSYLELIGPILLFISIILATKNKILNWPISIISQIIFFFLFYNKELYGNMIIQIYFTIISVYGWLNWKQKNLYDIKILNFKNYILLLISFLLMFLTSIQILIYYNGDFIILDSMTTTLSVIAIILLSKKYLESWYLWIIIDILSFILFYMKGLYILCIEYLILTFIASYGLLNWIKIKNNRHKLN